MHVKTSTPKIAVLRTESDHRQVVLALRDLLLACDEYNTGSSEELASAYHQARLVLADQLT
jgi:hypothetical protein